ncbi:MAG: NAD(P)/FAD-dependent oxidoreductase [Acidobacteria bacterium]|nr:NAD(P)/FAD-dependent oxidoreductase [Acidobacteriota bacterium]
MRTLAADAIVVGSGPNGLAAAITLAQAGVGVQVFEAQAAAGGGVRSAELTLPGFIHDLGSGIHPLAFDSPFFRTLPLQDHGLTWVHSPAPLAHALEGGDAVTLESSIPGTASQLLEDAGSYTHLFQGAAAVWSELRGSLRARPLLRHPATVARLALECAGSANGLAERNFRSAKGRALVAGLAGHASLPLRKASTAGIAIALATTGHVGGWPFPKGGAQKLTDALAGYLQSLGGSIQTGVRITSLRQLPPARAVLLDVTPRQFLAIGGDRLPARYAQLLRRFRYGMGAFKMDWALSQPVPWASPGLGRAATVHIGGTLEEIAAAEMAAWSGTPSEKPFLIAAQHSLFDPSRAPSGRHTLWAYCHVPNGASVDMTAAMEGQIERFAPGFRDCILARSVLPPRALESLNENLIGGDIMGGLQDLYQVLVRPTLRYWTTPLPGVYLCSASTPPGGGVHGMCGHIAARIALRRQFGIRTENP